jgi:hypothetical protein
MKVLCERCQFETAEYIIGNFKVCRRCDAKEPKLRRSRYVNPELDFFFDIDDEPTDPGIASYKQYVCTVCGRKDYYDLARVANGQACDHLKSTMFLGPRECGGLLKLVRP